nr:acyl-lipid (9-3)-desaturase-like [Ipomoea trifida]
MENNNNNNDGAKKFITTEELKNHNKPGDLWVSIHGKVYDVSEWVYRHPGGEYPLLSLAGQDVTDAFLAYHPAIAAHHLQRFFNGYYVSDHHVSEVSKDYRMLVSEFSKMGMFEKKGHLVMCYACALTAMMAVSFYGVVCTESLWVHMGCAVLVGFLWIQAGWVGHDSGHYDVMKTRKLSRAAQVLAGNCLTGVSIWWWRWNHNAHHIACNVIDYDPDVQLLPIFAFSSKFFQSSLISQFYEKPMSFNSLARFLVSYQHWTFYPVMLLIARINMFIQSWKTVLFKKKIFANRGEEILGLIIFWIWYPFLLFCLPNHSERIMFVVLSLMMTGVQQIQFSLNHLASSFFAGPLTGKDWVEKQIDGTLDIDCSPWMDWFHGGLQFQIEHHLFPRMPRCQLRKVSPFVKQLCEKHGIAYNHESFWAANVLMFKSIRDAALMARDLSPEKAPKNLVWEALNSFG